MKVLQTQDKIITVYSRKFDGTIHRQWQVKLLERRDSLLVFVGEFDREVIHDHLGVIRRGTISYEYYWLDKSYNIFRFHEPEGGFRNYYCNLNLPPTLENDILDYIDLDIDILVWKDFSTHILDEDEFQQNSRKFGYPEDLLKDIASALDEIHALIKGRIFPFDYQSI